MHTVLISTCFFLKINSYTLAFTLGLQNFTSLPTSLLPTESRVISDVTSVCINYNWSFMTFNSGKKLNWKSSPKLKTKLKQKQTITQEKFRSDAISLLFNIQNRKKIFCRKKVVPKIFCRKKVVPSKKQVETENKVTEVKVRKNIGSNDFCPQTICTEIQ